MEIKSKKQKSNGFTLIELLIAIAIMGILAAITLAGFHEGNKERAVVLGSDTIVTAIRTAQNYSLNPQPIEASTCATDKLPVEYRLVFSSSTNTILLRATDKCAVQSAVVTFTLPANVRVASGNNLKIDAAGVGAGGGILRLKFTPPFAKLSGSLNGGIYNAFVQSTIKVESNDGAFSRQINVDGITGRVNVQ